MKRILSLLLALVLVFCLVACGNAEPETAGVSFKVVVTDLERKEPPFDHTSDKATVGEALIAEGLIEGHDTEYGLYVDSVSGVSLVWDKASKYWAFYVDGEYAITGVDATEITELEQLLSKKTSKDVVLVAFSIQLQKNRPLMLYAPAALLFA